MTVAEAVRFAKLRLDPIAGEESLQQAKILIGYTLGLEEGALSLHHQMELTREQMLELASYLERRANHEPLQYIVGEWAFMGLPVLTDSRALIPRSDTETLAEAALSYAKESCAHTALDLCCGSGCIAVSLAALGGLCVTAADLSPDCLALTRENAELNGVTVETVCGDLFTPVRGCFDLIACNPPYLTTDELKSAQPELAFEPAAALDGGSDGLTFYRRIADQYRNYLCHGGALLLEIGSTQTESICRLFPGAEILPDVCGLPRVALIRT